MTGREDAIRESWRANASRWIDLIERRGIPSRVAVTNDAILDAVLAYAPVRVLDVGCGEGWLVRALQRHGVHGTGIDAVPAFIERASASGVGSFALVSYEDLAAGRHGPAGPFDAAVCNFSLFGEGIVARTLDALAALLGATGLLFVQTLHPRHACGGEPYVDGWREGSWPGSGAGFRSPPPWYFRTTDSWLTLLDRTGFDVLEVREPTAARSSTPASILFVARAR